ncbi:hypothetical protein G647_05321 [Cladophialophora carrionii CBS 160.54]|uniref:Ubiquitin-like domain-containing protein n=1 Tax=Cladophialophora carrionii CBS 160.54 TaxID=1279043 RepID=V9D9C3_9EURO|nr:uncharacterized protein G647_05321 [Cladophialophora carrionii CBS 160.54]ETI23519.1 hypothetical protein G647_05321 [Cladophialophora carrionii CBS 160.54]
MSVVGISPSDLVNGFLAAKRVVEALKDEDGSEQQAVAALTSLKHELAAVDGLEAFLDGVQDEARPSMVQVRDSEQVQASRTESTLDTRQTLERISRSETALSKPILQMQTAFEKGARRQHREGCQAQMTLTTMGKHRSPRLDTRSEVLPSFPSFKKPSRPLCRQLHMSHDQAVTPMLIAALFVSRHDSGLKITLRAFIDLARPDPASAILILCTIVAFSQMAVRLCPQLSILGADRVRFDDAFGSSIMLPFSTCEYPATFSGFLQQHFLGHPWQSFVLAGSYHLNQNNGRGRLVTEETWGSIVKPNSTVAMSMFLELGNKICIRCRKRLTDDGRDLFCAACGLCYALYAFARNDVDDEERPKGGTAKEEQRRKRRDVKWSHRCRPFSG